MNNNNQNSGTLDDIFGTAKAVTATLDGFVDVANNAYRNGMNVINNAQQQSSNFYCDDSNSRRNQQQMQYQNAMYNNNYGYGYGGNNNIYMNQQYPNVNSFYNTNSGMFGNGNYGYQGISNPSYGIMNNM